MVTMKSVKSSNIAAVGYDPETRELYISFKNSSYIMSDVTAEHAQGLIEAESPGRYFAQHIRGQYDYKKTEHPPPNTLIEEEPPDVIPIRMKEDDA